MPGAVKGYLLGYACRQEPPFEWSLQHLVLETVKDKPLVPFGFDEDMLRALYRDNAVAFFGGAPAEIDAERVDWARLSNSK